MSSSTSSSASVTAATQSIIDAQNSSRQRDNIVRAAVQRFLVLSMTGDPTATNRHWYALRKTLKTCETQAAQSSELLSEQSNYQRATNPQTADRLRSLSSRESDDVHDMCRIRQAMQDGDFTQLRDLYDELWPEGSMLKPFLYQDFDRSEADLWVASQIARASMILRAADEAIRGTLIKTDDKAAKTRASPQELASKAVTACDRLSSDVDAYKHKYGHFDSEELRETLVRVQQAATTLHILQHDDGQASKQ